MKKIYLLAIAVILLLSMACSLPFLDNSDDVPLPTVEIVVETPQMEVVDPTETAYSPPTAQPTSNKVLIATESEPESEQQEATEVPIETNIPSCPAYGIEEFSSPNDCWPNTVDDVLSVASVSDWNKLSVQVVNDRLEFSTRMAEDIFLYSFYQDNEYDEVIIRSSVSKIDPSVNGNGFTLTCHVNKDGWYEVRVASSGIFEVNQYDQLKKQQGANPYIKIASGGAPNFKTGEGRENIIEWQCGYDYLRFIVNEKQIWEKTGFSNLNSGGSVGVGLASYSGVFPRHIGFEWVEILEP